MTAKYIYLTLFVLLSAGTYAQQFNITGKVTDNGNNPLEYATVSVQNPESFEELFGGITDAAGEFSIEVGAGNYMLYIESFTGNVYEQSILIDGNQNLGTFKLGDYSVVALEGTTIVGNNQTYRMELDKKVYDLSQDPMSKGRSLSDALQNVPSVQVDTDGTCSLRGNESEIGRASGRVCV